jgi:hypothetical protein
MKISEKKVLTETLRDFVRIIGKGGGMVWFVLLIMVVRPAGPSFVNFNALPTRVESFYFCAGLLVSVCTLPPSHYYWLLVIGYWLGENATFHAGSHIFTFFAPGEEFLIVKTVPLAREFLDFV